MAGRDTAKKSSMRLDKFLTEMGQGTRSQVKEMARKGRIQVNGLIVKASDEKVNPNQDIICVDGIALGYAEMEYYMLNKPQGVVSATEDKKYKTVTDLIEDKLRRDLFPVGRLDIDTEGLLLITNDGTLAHNLLSPKKHVDKIYQAVVAGSLPDNVRERFAEGIMLEDGLRTLPAELMIAEGDTGFGISEEIRLLQEHNQDMREVLLTIHEGKFHQVKRMFEALECRVVYLKRIAMGPLTLDRSLEPGQYRPLSGEEILALKNCGNVNDERELG